MLFIVAPRSRIRSSDTIHFSRSRLGPYEILAPLGAGGMGEVYRARDARLGREVAVKVLPGDLASDPDRVRPLRAGGARGLGARTIPNIVTIYDIGSRGRDPLHRHGAASRARRCASCSPPARCRPRSCSEIAVADRRRSRHGARGGDRPPGPEARERDGLQGRLRQDPRLRSGEADGAARPAEQVSELPTAMADTRPGMVMGTVGYMSPEQASGKALDFRSDQFSFGSILYEMLHRQTRLPAATTAETLTAIIREEPEPVGAVNPRAPAPLRWIVERCLAKDPEERFGTTRDLARDLASIRDHLSEAVVVSGKRRRPRRSLAGCASGLSFSARDSSLRSLWPPSLWEEERRRRSRPPSVSSRSARGTISSARFAPDGQTVLYGASLEGKPTEIFVSRPESPESRPFGMPGASVLAISKSGEMALSLGQHVVAPFTTSGTLARSERRRRRRPAGDPRRRAVGRLGARWREPRHRSRRRAAETGWSSRSERFSTRRPDGSATRASRPEGTRSPSSTTRRGETTAGRSPSWTAPERRRRRFSESFETAQGLAWAPTAARSGSRRQRSGATAPSTP